MAELVEHDAGEEERHQHEAGDPGGKAVALQRAEENEHDQQHEREVQPDRDAEDRRNVDRAAHSVSAS